MDDESNKNYIWGELPTISDYFNLDEINNTEEIEDMFYEQSKKIGWSHIEIDGQQEK